MAGDPAAAARDGLDQVLAERHARFPHRQPGNTAAWQQALHRYYRQLAATSSPGPQPAPVRFERMLDRPVIVCGYLKSGTTLLVELLDGHSQLLVMPGDSHMLALRRRYAGSVEPDDVEAWAQHRIGRFINPKGQRPFWILGENDAYRQCLAHLRQWWRRLDGDARRPILAAVAAYDAANPSKPRNPVYWVAKTPRNERYVDRWRRLFPRARFIYVWRHPLPNLASLRRLARFRQQPWSPYRTLFSLYRSRLLVRRQRQALGPERVHILRYEQLIERPEAQLRRLAESLGIRWQKSLLMPTINGLPATANSMYPARQEAGRIVAASRPTWRSEFSRPEQILLLGIVTLLDRTGQYRLEGSGAD